jgi:hypothetical protein
MEIHIKTEYAIDEPKICERSQTAPKINSILGVFPKEED